MTTSRRCFAVCCALLVGHVAATARAATSYAVALAPSAGALWPILGGVESPLIAGVGLGVSGSNFNRAFLYNYQTNVLVDLHPPGWPESGARGISGLLQAGYASDSTTGHAMLWNGTAASAVDLHPAGYSQSVAAGIWGTTEVGYAYPSVGAVGLSHAMLWHGTAASAVDLHPSDYQRSAAYGVWGDTQVGYGEKIGSNPVTHAVLWQGTAASLVNLHPAGYSESLAFGCAEGVQVGYATASSNTHAVLWRGTAASVVDLQPDWAGGSEALAAAGNVQVGFTTTTGNTSLSVIGRAAVWQGTAASAADLHAFLSPSDFASLYPPGETITIQYSRATGVDLDGVIVGHVEVNGTRSGPKGVGVRWTPIPEPATLPLAFASLIAAIARARPKRR